MNSLTASHPQAENAVKIVVTEVIGDTLCIASEDGQKVYEQIVAAFKEGKKVILSFKNGEDITPAFLSDAIGHLYATFPEEQIQASLSVVDMAPDDQDMIEDVIYWAKQYLKDPQRFRDAARQAFGEDYE